MTGRQAKRLPGWFDDTAPVDKGLTLFGASLFWRSPVSVRSVLIVEGTLLAIVLSEVFEDAGYRVHVATNVDDAVELLSRVDIDLLVVDEKQDCGALVVWALEYAPRAKIIVASDNASAEDMPGHEFDACIAKALMPERLLTIAEVLLQPGTAAANDHKKLTDGRETTGWPRKNAL